MKHTIQRRKVVQLDRICFSKSMLNNAEFRRFFDGNSRTDALCGHPHVKVSIRDLSQISTAAPIFQLYIYFRQNLEENVTFTFFFFSFASNFPCKILWNNKDIDANIFIFQIAFSQWRAGLSKKLFWDVFLRMASFIFMKNFSFNSPALHIFL